MGNTDKLRGRESRWSKPKAWLAAAVAALGIQACGIPEAVDSVTDKWDKSSVTEVFDYATNSERLFSKDVKRIDVGKEGKKRAATAERRIISGIKGMTKEATRIGKQKKCKKFEAGSFSRTVKCKVGDNIQWHIKATKMNDTDINDLFTRNDFEVAVPSRQSRLRIIGSDNPNEAFRIYYQALDGNDDLYRFDCDFELKPRETDSIFSDKEVDESAKKIDELIGQCVMEANGKKGRFDMELGPAEQEHLKAAIKAIGQSRRDLLHRFDK